MLRAAKVKFKSIKSHKHHSRHKKHSDLHIKRRLALEYLTHKGAALKRCQLHITGIVQGVGFRPFVYRYALEYQLTGTVLNNVNGVTIELQGTEDNLTQFITTLNTTPPPLARIDNITQTPLPILLSETAFEIIKSDNNEDDYLSSSISAQVAVSADKSICQDCLNDMQNPDDRHFGYAFTNCTNCGPRYTIINALPYDRHNTAMADFDMCPDCAKAYQDPLDRRYHAQPVSCPACGPRLSLKTPQREYILPNTSNVSAPELSTDLAVLQAAADRLQQGQILAIKGLGGFHLICDAKSNNAINTLRLRKQRQAKPLAVMMADITMAQQYVTGTDAEWQVLSSQERPIVLMNSKAKHDLSLAVAPNLNKLGVFLPYTPLHHLLLSLFKGPLVATSANVSGEPIITDCDELINSLSHVVDAIVDHNRPIINGCDDSVVQVIQTNTQLGTKTQIQMLRLARGYAPLSFSLDTPLSQSILAVGAQQKNAIALGFGSNVFLSPHIGDLFSVGAEQYFERTLATFSRLYHFEPQLIIRDKHPDYAPSRWAETHSNSNVELDNTHKIACLAVQHHHAHVLSVMAANQYKDTVLGFSFDGTGLGDDGSLWGGEALLTTLDKAQRLAYFEPISLLGGEQAIKQPVRLLLALLFKQMNLNAVLALNLPILSSLSPNTLTNLYKIWQNDHALKSSSVGRLFDALACALGLIETTQFEGQAGMAIEAAANRADALALDVIQLNLPLDVNQWKSSEIFKQIVELITEKPLTDNRRDTIARAFLHTLGDTICDYAAQYKNIPTVLCGGVFQNKYLLEYCLSKLTAQGNHILPSKLIPINDGGIALGQLWYGMHQHTINT